MASGDIFVGFCLLFLFRDPSLAMEQASRSWNVLLESCSDLQSQQILLEVEAFLGTINASHQLRLVHCNNPVALNFAVQSSFAAGVTHFVVAGSASTLDLSSRCTLPPGATLDYFTLDDFLFLHQWNGTNYVAQLLRSAFVRWAWKYAYFYIDSYYETSLHSNVHMTKEELDPYIVEQLNFVEKSTPLEFASSLKRSQVRHVRSVAVAVNESVTLEVVRTASEKGLLSSEHRWIVFFNGNLSTLFDVLQLQANSHFYVVRHSPDSSWDIKTILVEYLKLQEMSLLGHNEPSADEDSDERSASQTLMHWMEDGMSVDILRLYLNEAGSITSRLGARWDPRLGLVAASSSRYANYQQRSLKVVTSEAPPYVIIQRDSSDVPHFSGYLVDLLMVVASILNFTVDYIPVKGAGSVNSTWNGVVEMLVKKQADVGLYDLAISPDLLRLIDFAQVAVDAQFTAGLFRRPGSEGNDKFGVYLEPFDLQVWIASVVTIFVLVASLYFSAWVTKRLGDEVALRWDNDDINVSRTILLGFQAVAQQGCELNFGNPSTRIVFVVLWLFALICYASYSATLMSYLTITKVVMPFTSLTTLARNRDYRIGFLDGSSHLEMFRDSSSSVYQSVWKRVLASRFTTVVDDYAEGLSRVQSEKFVLLSDDKTLHYVTRNTCDLVVSDPLTSAQFVTLGFQKDSPHQEAFSRALRLMTDAGILYRMRDKWWGTAVFCQQETQVFVSLSLTNVATGFLLLLAGIAFGSLALALEASLRCCGCVTVKRETTAEAAVRLKINRSFRHRPRLRLHF